MRKNRFSAEERVEIIRESVARDNTLEVATSMGCSLTTRPGASVPPCYVACARYPISSTNFSSPHMNRRLRPGFDSVFMMTGEDYFFIASKLVREVATYGGDVSPFVPAHVAERIKAKLGRKGP